MCSSLAVSADAYLFDPFTFLKVPFLWPLVTYLLHLFNQSCSNSLNSVIRRCDSKMYFARQTSPQACFMRQVSNEEARDRLFSFSFILQIHVSLVSLVYLLWFLTLSHWAGKLCSIHYMLQIQWSCKPCSLRLWSSHVL